MWTTTQAVTGYFMAPGQEPYKGTLPLSKLLCSKEEYLHRRDVKHEENFYALWPQDSTIPDYVPQPSENLDPPDDSFANLHALGFPNPGYTGTIKPPPATQPPPSQPPLQSDVGASRADVKPNQPRIDLDDLDFGFELDDE